MTIRLTPSVYESHIMLLNTLCLSGCTLVVNYNIEIEIHSFNDTNGEYDFISKLGR